ncbi:MAG: TetR/AcrR family transcriptional regulator [Pseudomonadota bacterium]
MGDSYADRRRSAIEDAAYEVLAEKGYKAASMLEVAKRAGASNETLYKWYGNKQGLFASLVKGNAELVTQRLDDVMASGPGDDPLRHLQIVGEALIEMLTSERAIAINRAAAGDVHDTNKLGKALAQAGRDAVLPRISVLLERAIEQKILRVASIPQMADVWTSLLIGDKQIRLVTGQIDCPSAAERTERATFAVDALRKLFGRGSDRA